MPRYKPVSTLSSLALQETSKLVLHMCKKVEELYPSDLYLDYDVIGRKEKIQEMQDFLRQNVQVSVWEELFHTVVKQHELRDVRIICGVFFHENVNLKKLTVTGVMYKKYLKTNGFSALPNSNHTRFWLQQIPKLSNLVEVKFYVEDDFDCTSDKIALALSRCCPELQILRVRCSPETYKTVLRSCTKLRELDGRFPAVYNALLALDTNEKLQLRSLNIFEFPLQDLKKIFELCPHLQNLRINAYTDWQQDVFQLLSESPLRISRLTDVRDNGSLSKYLSCKGIYITDLTICYGSATNPVNRLKVISENCKNLTKLCLTEIEDLTLIEQAENPSLTTRISFPKLEELMVTSVCMPTSGLLYLLRHCMQDAEQLTSLKVFSSGEDLPEVEAEFVQLVNSQSRRMKQLRRLTLKFPDAHFTAGFVRQLYKSCPSLTLFSIKGLSPEAELYCQGLEEEIERFDSKDWDLCF